MPPGRIVGGSVLLNGRDLLTLPTEEMRMVRGREISMIFQEPMTSLNPVFRVGEQIAEVFRLHQGMNRRDAEQRSVEMLRMVGIPSPEKRASDYPHQMSGGMRQRVMIAIALACRPRVMLADEPTTALDVTIQAQIVELVKRLRDELGMAIIWITHDLGVVASIAHRVLVMYGGYIIEEANVKDLYVDPRHPYTLGLLGSLPLIHEETHKKLFSIEGMPPVLYQKPNSCPFAPRCSYVTERCWQENPLLEKVGEGHRVACWVDTRNGRK
jgi:oligopeptide transport system ATP-binding protein